MREVNFNGIAVGDLTVNFLDTPAKVVVKAAFINTKTGATHGWTTCQQWSNETMAKLKELRECLEQDLSVVHFADSSSNSAVVPATAKNGNIKEGFKGLGEALGSAGDDVPQG